LQIARADRGRRETRRVHDPLAIALLVAAAVALIWLAAVHARYRAVYRFDDEDLRAARKDATRRSRGVLGGKAGEQLAPLAPGFCERFDPSEARFLGAPIDYVIFDGLGAGELREIVLLEVKTGGSRLNRNEREVEIAVREGRVRFELLRLG
jgi:predicted Holliday junction resolvase-like endonuclease